MNFIKRFQKNALPDDIPEVTITAEGELTIASLLKQVGLVASTSEAIRMIKQGAAKIDGDKITDKDLEPASGTAVYQVGKRKFARITIS